MATDIAEKTTLELIDELCKAGDWPDPKLFHAIIARDTEAVAPIIDIVTHHRSDTPAHYYGCRLLGSIGDPAAIPPLLATMRNCEDDAIADLESALAQFGPPVIEPLLEIVSDSSLDWYPRICACQTALMAALDDADTMAHVTKALRELLANYISRAQTLLPDHYEMATFLVHYLTEVLDPEARQLIQAAFDADIINTAIIAPDDVERDYHNGQRRLREPDPQEWLHHYTNRRQKDIAYERRMERERLRKASMPVAPLNPRPLLDPVELDQQRTSRNIKLGRNDRCWCGSGKKYKHCHLRSDTR